MAPDREKLWPIYEQIRTERWFAQKHLTPLDISVHDSLIFDDANGIRHQWLLMRVEPETKVYSVVIKEEADSKVTLASPVSLMEKLRHCAALPTVQGGTLRYSGPQNHVWPVSYQPLEVGNSSNSLYVTSVGDGPCVAKFYRKMDGASTRERQTLVTMQGTGFTPCLVGEIEYLAPQATGPSNAIVICLLLELISGTPAFMPFQAAARSALARLKSGCPVQPLLDEDAYVLPELCEGLGQGIAGFHTAALAVCQPSAPPAPLVLALFIDALRDRWQRVDALVEQADGTASVLRGDQRAMMALLDDLADRAHAEPHDLKTCFSHGDLHLSHIILDDALRCCRIIDPSHGLGLSADFDHSACDLFQIGRGFECFVFDEIATMMAADTGRSREQAAARLASAADADSARNMAFAAAWSRKIFSTVLEAYSRNLPERLRGPIADPRWRAAFYLDRLLHEMEYDVVYGRQFYLSSGMAFLRNFLSSAEHNFPRRLPA